MATGDNNTHGEITDPAEISRIQASIRGPEQAPSSRQQLGNFANWKQMQEALGQPFNNERVPLPRLKLMRRDPMIGFGLHFTKTPLVRAPWYMKSMDPQVAAFMDAALRPVMPSFITQCLQKLEFGFQAMGKRFQFAAPDGTYVDPVDGQEKPVWAVGGTTGQGGIEPVILKPFVALPPEGCVPIWDDSSGEFNGILYKPPEGAAAPAGTGSKSKGKGGSEGGVEIDLYHSLWATNEKDSVFGNIYGYPRLGYVYPYWWSYWFRWAIADRAFEKKGDPAVIVRHPEGKVLINNVEVDNADYALLMAERLRSGAGLALPSTPYMGLDDKPSNAREWDIEFLKGGVELDPFDKSFNYLDVQKLRSIFVPEQALIEGGGGTSSRNVAEEMYQGLVEAQSLLMSEAIDMVNRFIIPQLMIVNFPEKWEAGVRCTMEARGFQAQDMELLQQIVQLVGQSNIDELGIDVREALRQMNMPLLSEAEYQRRLTEKAAQANADGPGEIPPTTSSSGVVPTPGRAPATNGNAPGPESNGVSPTGSFTGFTYVPAIDRIELSDGSVEYLGQLPTSSHYRDQAVRALSRQLWQAMRDFYRGQYLSFADYLDEIEGEIALTDEDGVELAPTDFMRDWARRVVRDWATPADRLREIMERTRAILRRIIERASALTRREAGLTNEAQESERDNWVESRMGDVLSKTIATTRSELEDFVANFINEGELDAKKLAANIRAHFSDFPEWKANRYARTETRDAYNAGVLLTGQANGLSVAQAIDGQAGPTDSECEHRNGQFFTIDQALNEAEHPNGTLEWRLIDGPVTISRVAEVPSELPGVLGTYDEEDRTIYLDSSIDHESEQAFLLSVGETLAR